MIPMEIYQIRGSSNLSVDKIYSIVALRMSWFPSLSNNVLPFAISFIKVLRRVYCLSLIVEPWGKKM